MLLKFWKMIMKPCSFIQKIITFKSLWSVRCSETAPEKKKKKKKKKNAEISTFGKLSETRPYKLIVGIGNTDLGLKNPF